MKKYLDGATILDASWDEKYTGTITLIIHRPGEPEAVRFCVGTVAGDPYPYTEALRDGDKGL